MKEYLDITIAQKLEETARRFPDRIAVSYPGRRLSYSELDELSDHTARAFLSCGIKKGSHTALFSANQPELAVIALALWKIGAVVIPLCTAYSASEQLSALRKSDAEQLILIGRPVNGSFAVPKGKLEGIRIYVFTEPGDLTDFIISRENLSVAEDAAWEDNLYYDSKSFPSLEDAKALVRPEDPDMILFTSGSTGGARPVISTHKARINLAMTHADYLEADENDIFCAVLPLYHCFAITGVMLAALSCGAELAFPKDRHSENVARCIEKRRCTVLSAVPTFYSALMRCKEENGADFSSLRTGMIGGSPYSSGFFRKVCEELDITLLPSIGMTETTAGYSSGRLSDSLELRASSLGEVFPELECRIADEKGNPLPAGETGRIMLKGPSVVGRYYNDLASPCLYEKGWMDTGDLGCLDERGYLYFKGRSKEIIIRGGENISPIEIENALKGIPGIQELKAVGVPDPHRIEEICLCIVMEKDAPDDAAGAAEKKRSDEIHPTEKQPNENQIKQNEEKRERLERLIREAAGEKLSSYMQPKYLVFMESLPRKESGKIDINALKQATAELCCIKNKEKS